MPPRMLKRGRPKGAGLTVIGLPKKRKVTGAIPFIKKSPTEKERVLLNCFLERKEVESALRGALAEEEMVEVRPVLDLSNLPFGEHWT
ncbi:Hypothetical predicted protein [Paramuricea clavata]|nr:Hypothetical predicted protein [Paramuricea clavata]